MDRSLIMPPDVVAARLPMLRGYVFLGVRNWAKPEPAIGADHVCSDCGRDVSEGRDMHAALCSFWDAYPQATPF